MNVSTFIRKKSFNLIRFQSTQISLVDFRKKQTNIGFDLGEIHWAYLYWALYPLPILHVHSCTEAKKMVYFEIFLNVLWKLFSCITFRIFRFLSRIVFLNKRNSTLELD